jgi:hypothetical protein
VWGRKRGGGCGLNEFLLGIGLKVLRVCILSFCL